MASGSLLALRSAVATLFLGAAFSQATAAQVSYVSGITKVATGEAAKDAIQDMKAGLRNLVTAQEAYYSDHNRYGRDVSRDNRDQVFILPPPGVTLSLTYVTTNAWTARATHEWLPGLSCVIFVGKIPPSRTIQTATGRLEATTEGAPACDQPTD